MFSDEVQCAWIFFQLFTKNTIIDVSRLKVLADVNLYVAEMIHVLDRVGIIVEKGENAGYHNYFFFAHFRESNLLGTLKFSAVCLWIKQAVNQWVKLFVISHFLYLPHSIIWLTVGPLTISQTSPAVQVFRKHSGKRRSCSLRAISPFPTVFSSHLENFLLFTSNSKLSSAMSFSFKESKFRRLGKG